MNSNQLALFDEQNAPTYGELGQALVFKENRNSKGFTTSKIWALPGRKRVAEMNGLSTGSADRKKIDAIISQHAEKFNQLISGKVGVMMADADAGLVYTKVRLKKNGGFSVEANPLSTLLKGDGSKPFDPEEAIKAMISKGMTEDQILDLLEKVTVEAQAAIEAETLPGDVKPVAETEHTEAAPEAAAEPETVEQAA